MNVDTHAGRERRDVRGGHGRHSRFWGWGAGVVLGLAGGAASAATPAMNISTPPWPGAEVKAEIVSQIFNALGYQADVSNISAPMGIKAVASGDSDMVLDVWVPSEKGTLDSAMKSGNIIIAGTNLKDALYGIVVPDYVWNAGVHSIGDLHKYPDKFGRTVYGIDPGSDGNLIVKKAIDDGTYDLKGWTLLPSTTAAMLAQAKQKIDSHQWVAFLGWKPHWMNLVYHLKYLEDPADIWGKNYVIYSIANKQYLQKNPNVTRFLKNFAVTSKIQSQWIYDYSFKKLQRRTVARDWIEQNLDTVDGWLQGVTAADGKPAAAIVNAAFRTK